MQDVTRIQRAGHWAEVYPDRGDTRVTPTGAVQPFIWPALRR